MSVDPKVSAIAGKIARLALDLALGDRSDAIAACKEIFFLLTDLIPVDQLREFLTDRDRTFTDLEVDIEESMKLEAEEKR
jgi:hypothetical protein